MINVMMLITHDKYISVLVYIFGHSSKNKICTYFNKEEVFVVSIFFYLEVFCSLCYCDLSTNVYMRM